MFLDDSLLLWKNKKQAHISKYSTESECRAISTACSEIAWLRRLLVEVVFTQMEPTPLHTDNVIAI